MTKRLIDVDDDLIAQAREHLGTKTLKDTVNRALADSVAAAARGRVVTRDDVRRFVEATEDLRDPAIMAKAWE